MVNQKNQIIYSRYFLCRNIFNIPGLFYEFFELLKHRLIRKITIDSGNRVQIALLGNIFFRTRKLKICKLDYFQKTGCINKITSYQHFENFTIDLRFTRWFIETKNFNFFWYNFEKIFRKLENVITFASAILKIVSVLLYYCGCGEIGRHARLRIWCCEAWGFESLHPHFSSSKLSFILLSIFSNLAYICRPNKDTCLIHNLLC